MRITINPPQEIEEFILDPDLLKITGNDRVNILQNIISNLPSMAVSFNIKIIAFKNLSLVDKKVVVIHALEQILSEGEIFPQVLAYVKTNTISEGEIDEIYTIILRGVCAMNEEKEQHTIQEMESVRTLILDRQKTESRESEQSIQATNLLFSAL